MTNDLISREALMAELSYKAYYIGNFDIVQGIVKAAPAVDAAPVVHGRWINKGYITTAYGSIETGDCSVCGAVDVPIEPYEYHCPNCGARMDKEESDV